MTKYEGFARIQTFYFGAEGYSKVGGIFRTIRNNRLVTIKTNICTQQKER